MKILFAAFILLIFQQTNAQKIIYSDVIGEDNHEINFEILGKVGDRYPIYKNVRWKHMLAIYDDNMKLIDNSRLTFMPDRTYNIDFIRYPDHFYIVYQYQRNSIIYCKAAKINKDGKKISGPILLDTSRVGLLVDKRIYSTTFSEDKSHILIYKMQRKNDKLNLTTKIYNKDLSLLDSARQILPFNEPRDYYSDLSIDNKGNFLLAREHRRSNRDGITKLEIIVRNLNSPTNSVVDIPLSEKLIDDVNIKVDNLNNKYLINALFYDRPQGNISGLFTSKLNASDLSAVNGVPNHFSDSLRSQIATGGAYRSVFDNMFIRDVVVKRDGGFLITAEDYSVTRTGSNMDSWRRNDLYNSPYTNSMDYYMNSSRYHNFYRPYSFYSAPNSRYYYNDIIIMSLDKNMNPDWSNVIHKKQVEDQIDNFLSYSTMNSGSEIHFLFIENNRNNQVITNQSVNPAGSIRRYGTLKGNENGNEFMPKMAKQVGIRTMIVPAIYRNNIRFALVDFSE